MRRLVPLVLLVALGLVSTPVILGPGASTVAQEATPIVEAGDPEALAGVSAQLLTVAEGVELPSLATMEFLSFQFAPNAGFPLNPDDPATALAYVAAGTLSFRVEAPITVQRGSMGGPPNPGNVEEIASGEIFTLSEGDSAIFPPRAVGEVLNLGEEPAILLALNIYPTEGQMAMATPTN